MQARASELDLFDRWRTVLIDYFLISCELHQIHRHQSRDSPNSNHVPCPCVPHRRWRLQNWCSGDHADGPGQVMRCIDDDAGLCPGRPLLPSSRAIPTGDAAHRPDVAHPGERDGVAPEASRGRNLLSGTCALAHRRAGLTLNQARPDWIRRRQLSEASNTYSRHDAFARTGVGRRARRQS